MPDQTPPPASSHAQLPLDNCLQQMLSEAREEAISDLSIDDVTALGTELWKWASPETGVAMRVRPAAGKDGRALGAYVLETVGPDRPFLVDSLLNACTEFGFEVKTLFHPILPSNEGHRSLIQIHLPVLTETEQNRLLEEVEATLHDVALATSDYVAMRERMATEIVRLETSPHVSERYKTEAVEFLKWICSERFVFLGMRDYTFKTAPDGTVLPEEPDMVEGSNLGLLRDEDRNVLNRGAEPLLLTDEISGFLSEPESLILAKATLESRVHRRVACDYVGIKHYGPQGNVIGETRLLGLYTAEAYNESVRNIPLLRRRVERVIELSGAVKGTHNEKALSNIMESWPRDELIQTKSEVLAPIMKGALHLIGRPRVRLFVRPDRFNRFVSAVVFVPRDSYDTATRVKIGQKLESAWNGRLSRFEPSFDGPAFVRVLYEIVLPDDALSPDIDALERDITELARTWNDRFRAGIITSDLDEQAKTSASLFMGSFTAGYREAFQPDEAMADIGMLSSIDAEHPIRLRAFRLKGDEPEKIRAKIYARNGAIALSDCVPVFERMGLFVAFETGYPVTPMSKPVADAPDTYWVHSLSMRRGDGKMIDLDAIGAAFEAAFVAIWRGQAENDGFNALIFNAGLTWREAALCRTLSAYRHQTGLDPARPTQIEALNANPKLTRMLVDLFKARFDPAIEDDRALAQTSLRANIDNGLRDVKSLDHDRVIRRTADLIMATQRTNYYQTNSDGSPRPFIAIKIATQDLEDVPAPKPYREIFMSSPQVEGVHCRFGAVARGGLRWSDRRDDFRTEVLGLVKAQQVKNAVIVPVGSKGGFFPKQLPANGTREEIRDAGVEAYKTFITSLLDVTDNLIDGQVKPPKQTVIHDGEDPYLVVAADKGTATFSDIANEISVGQGFWLGDAFASGGSAGYDHKKMGITARGAWEAVKRHFREMDKDIQTEPFTVIGCGDMSGDVFGNGMLLSKQIRLQAAFNHLHIFVDPDPQDPERLWEERQRMFDLPRSSWMDYDQSLISAGGGIFDRSAKSIDLSDEIKALTGLKSDSVTPDELIHALLKTQVELLWFGGIGTYIKARSESHAEAGDRANDGLRVNGRELGAKVIGEGANLGLTQAGRIEAARHGVRLNTDAIDNSAGVDSSDHEVNIKILCTEAMRRGDLPTGERNTLLASMTDDVAKHVLAHNYAQTGALSIAVKDAAADHDAYERLMVKLEGRGVLDRTVEGLPDTATMSTRASEGKPLTAPEIAVLMAWTKIVLFDDLIASDVPDDPYFIDTLRGYFPKALLQYEDAMQAHRLKREIIATVLANRLIDVTGPLFLMRLREQTGEENASIVMAYEVARNLLNGEDLQSEIAALDNKVPATQQMALTKALADALSELAQGLIDHGLQPAVETNLNEVGPCLNAMRETLDKSLSGFEAKRLNKLTKKLAKDEVPSELAETIAKANFVSEAPLLVDLAREQEADPKHVFATYQTIGEALSIDRLRDKATSAIPNMPFWDRLATRRLVRELEGQQAAATRLALEAESSDAWLKTMATPCSNLVKDIKTYTATNPNFAQFTLAAGAVRNFMQTAT
jgi:glutamate dehydrogenase